MNIDLGYSSLFTAGLGQQQPDICVTPPRRVAHPPRSYTTPSVIPGIKLPPIITTAPTPDPVRPKLARRRRSSVSLGTNPLSVLKSPTRSAKTTMMSPARENRRFFDYFGGASLTGAVSMLRSRKRTVTVAEQKPAPSLPLPLPPIVIPNTPRRRSRLSTNPPSSPTTGESSYSFAPKKVFKRGKDLIKLRLTPPDMLLKSNASRPPLSPSFLSLNALSPSIGGHTPDLMYGESPTTGFMTAATPSSSPGYFDWGMKGVKEENEEHFDEEEDVDMT